MLTQSGRTNSAAARADSLALVSAGSPIETFEVTCPHCNEPFTAQLIEGAAPPHRGFKCPHCRLFVPYERASGGDAPAAQAS
jgi:hypothetical protein